MNQLPLGTHLLTVNIDQVGSQLEQIEAHTGRQVSATGPNLQEAQQQSQQSQIDRQQRFFMGAMKRQACAVAEHGTRSKQCDPPVVTVACKRIEHKASQKQYCASKLRRKYVVYRKEQRQEVKDKFNTIKLHDF